jgi:hypothetical protein
MVRARWIALALVAAFVAPWAAPCLAAAPSDEAMPCCPASGPGAPATVKPCCPEDRQPSTSGGVPTTAVHSATVAVGASPFARTVFVTPIPLSAHRAGSLDVRFLSTVLLI